MTEPSPDYVRSEIERDYMNKAIDQLDDAINTLNCVRNSIDLSDEVLQAIIHIENARDQEKPRERKG